jgi:hypothetical protein
MPAGRREVKNLFEIITLNKLTMNTETFPIDESPVIFTDLLGVRRRGIYKKNQGFKEISEMEIPEEEQFFYSENDIAAWEYEPESQSE